MLKNNEDGSCVLNKERLMLCLKASWELSALAEMLPLLTTNETCKESRTRYQVRCVAGRISKLSQILSSGLDDDGQKTEELESELNTH